MFGPLDCSQLTDDMRDEKRQIAAIALRRMEVEEWDKERMRHFYYGLYGLGPWCVCIAAWQHVSGKSACRSASSITAAAVTVACLEAAVRATEIMDSFLQCAAID